MSTEHVRDTAVKLVAHCRAGTTREGLRELYDPEAVSVEAMSMGGEDPVTRGVQAIDGKHVWWEEAMEVHSSSADGPYLHGDHFAVIFEFDATERASGKRLRMKEVGIYFVNQDGKIIREEFCAAA